MLVLVIDGSLSYSSTLQSVIAKHFDIKVIEDCIYIERERESEFVLINCHKHNKKVALITPTISLPNTPYLYNTPQV